MGTVVNIVGMGMGLVRQHEGMGRAWELDGQDGTNVRGAGGCGVATPTPCKTLSNVR